MSEQALGNIKLTYGDAPGAFSVMVERMVRISCHYSGAEPVILCRNPDTICDVHGRLSFAKQYARFSTIGWITSQDYGTGLRELRGSFSYRLLVDHNVCDHLPGWSSSGIWVRWIGLVRIPPTVPQK